MEPTTNLTLPAKSPNTDNTPTMSRKLLQKLQSTVTNANVAVRVYVIRHGETNWNKKGKIQGGGYDVPLNPNGQDQAQTAALALEGIRLDAVTSSVLARAKETADIVYAHYTANNSNKPLRIVDAGFNEMRFGKFEGLSKEDTKRDEALKQYFLEEKKKVWKDPSYCFPSKEIGEAIHLDDEVYRVDDANSGRGESTNIVEDRTMRALSDAIQQVLENAQDSTTTKHVAIVSHGRTNKVLIGGMLDQGSAKSIGQSNANISVLDHPGWDTTTKHVNAKGGWTARVLNYTEHIKEIETKIERP